MVILEKDNQKVKIEFRQFKTNDSIVFAYSLTSWRYNGQIYTQNNGVNYLFDGDNLIHLITQKQQLGVYSSKQAEEFFNSESNKINFDQVKSDSILKSSTDSSIIFKIFPLSDDEISYSEMHFNKVNGQLNAMIIVPSVDNQSGLVKSTVLYRCQKISQKDFPWKSEDYIIKSKGEIVLSKKYQQYELINYTK